MRLIGANANATVTGADELPGRSNYFIGNDPKKWRTNVANYAKVKYQNVYPGVDLVYYGNQRQLEYDFVVAPGADPSTIALDVGAVPDDIGTGREPPTVAAGLPRHLSHENGGVKPPLRGRAHRDAPLQIAADGDLVVKTDAGEVRFHKPLVYQPAIYSGQRTTDNGLRTPVEGYFVLQADNQVGFNVASYDHTRPLVIDPVLSYSTYLGGSGLDYGTSIAVDSSGSAYVTGVTYSTDFPTVNPLQSANTAGSKGTAFVTKLNPAGTAIVYSTYLGGSGNPAYGDRGQGIAVDSSGNAYVTGVAFSPDFPTVNAFQASSGGGAEDAFVAKLNATGSTLIYSTYLGGSSFDIGYGIAVDSSDSPYVTGATFSTDFPTANPVQPTNPGGYAVFVTKFNAAGSALVYSTYLGGGDSWGNFGRGIAVDMAGNAYVTGQACSTNFPTVNAIQPTLASECGSAQSGGDAFVAKFNAAGSAIIYSTYLGGNGDDVGLGIAADSSGNAYITGYTKSTNFPTSNPLQANSRGGYDVFVTKLNATGSGLIYSTYLGGARDEAGYGIAIDSSGNSYVAGFSASTDFPMANPSQAAYGGGVYDTFLAKLNPTGAALVYSSYLGGSDEDRSYGIALDSAGNAYVTGFSASTDFPTVNPIQPTNNGGGDAFVAKISSNTGGSQNFTLSASPGSATVAAGQLASYTVTVTGVGGFGSTVSLGCTGVPQGASCSLLPSTVTPSGSNPSTAAVTVTTTARSNAPPRANRRASPRSPWQLLLLLVLSILLAVWASWRDPVSLRRRAAWTLTMIAMGALLLFACGGPSTSGSGGGGGGGSNGTPAGTYQITFTGTSGSLTHSAGVTLIVN
jgi:hypothetical protein